MAARIDAVQTLRLTQTNDPRSIESMPTILTLHERGNASPTMNITLSGSKTKLRHVPAKAADSIRDTELDPNKLDESD
jgi:hypothetical protein